MNQVPFDLASSPIPTLPPKKIQAAIRELEWCVEELHNVDVYSVNDRDDPRIDALESAIEDALLSLFDKNSTEFQHFHCASLVDNACFSLAYPTPIHEVRQGLESGIGVQTARLNEAVTALNEALSIFHPEEVSTPAEDPSRAMALARSMAEMVGIRSPSPVAAAKMPPTDAEDGSRNVLILNTGDTPQTSTVIDFITDIDMTAKTVRGNRGENGERFALYELDGAGFAVIILTPDDIRTINDPHTSPDFRPCPAQEILFGLGYLIGVLGPGRVCALVVDDVDAGLDQFGLHVTPMDRGEGWKLDLAKMIKSAGVSIDMNRVI